MKYAVIAIIIACWTALAFLYRLGAKKNAPLNWLSASAALTWLTLNVILATAGGADVGSAPRRLYLAGVLGGIGLVAAIPHRQHGLPLRTGLHFYRLGRHMHRRRIGELVDLAPLEPIARSTEPDVFQHL